MPRKSRIGYCEWCGTYGHLSDGLCRKCYCKKYYREVTRPVICKKDKEPKFSDENLRIYLEYQKGGVTQADLARKYGKSRQAVSNLIHRIEKGEQS